MTPPEDVTDEESAARLSLLHEMQKDFETTHKGRVLDSRHSAYERAVKLMQTTAATVFDLEKEPQKARDAYGQDPFGQSCLLARRLVEHGVPFVEVNGSSPGWDSHGDNFTQQQRMSELIDTPWAALMSDLKERGLLDSTLIIWMGEFGRTPKINQQNGRDHFPLAWTTVLAGGGIKGGQAVGKTSEDGMSVEERPVSQSDFLATVCKILGIDHSKQYVSNIGRPIRIVDAKARAVTEVVA
jgi:uncharacterized protein (DUF1501 family)